jgi:hypothetical protein
MTLTTGSLEERVGISQFLNKDNPGFRGTIKERGVPNTAEGGDSKLLFTIHYSSGSVPTFDKIRFGLRP